MACKPRSSVRGLMRTDSHPGGVGLRLERTTEESMGKMRKLMSSPPAMPRVTPRILLFAGALGAAAMSPQARACSACGCTLSSDWASQGLTASGGWRADVRFDWFNQDQLRSGTDSVSRSRLPLPNETEIQQYTINRNYSFDVDYS